MLEILFGGTSWAINTFITFQAGEGGVVWRALGGAEAGPGRWLRAQALWWLALRRRAGRSGRVMNFPAVLGPVSR